MVEAKDLTSMRRRKVRDGFIGLDLREVLILLDDISFLHIPAQQFHLRDAFANVWELELTCHALTSQRQDRVLRIEC
jgi:hypothetical protein